MGNKALIVGINAYGGGSSLNGCVPDARDVANTLSSLGIVESTGSSMKILTDKNATKANIMAGLKWLVSGAKAKDVLVFYYSGHGTYIADTNKDETDRKDECLCPVDFQRNLIVDDELAEIFKTVPEGVNLEVILDSCFSGSATRELKKKHSGRKIRFMEPPLDHSFIVDSNPKISTRKINPAEKMNHVLWAASQSYQTSAEDDFDGSGPRGAFTLCFCKALRGAGKEVFRRKLSSQVSRDVKKLGVDQVPNLEGKTEKIDKKIFT